VLTFFRTKKIREILFEVFSKQTNFCFPRLFMN